MKPKSKDRSRPVNHAGENATPLRYDTYRRVSPRPDKEIREEMLRLLSGDPELKNAGIEVDVDDGVVLLRGTVDTVEIVARAEALAKEVRGVRRLDNQLRDEATARKETPGRPEAEPAIAPLGRPKS